VQLQFPAIEGGAVAETSSNDDDAPRKIKNFLIEFIKSQPFQDSTNHPETLTTLK
jgi:hypothetical protein